MKKFFVFVAAVALSASAVAAEKTALADALDNHFKFYGFIRNYFAFDTYESKSGTGDLFHYLPVDRSLDATGVDTNFKNQFRFLAITSRAGVDVSGYRIAGIDFGAKIEADFYCLDSNKKVAMLRLRQAFVTVKKSYESGFGWSLKMGQAWHPLAADLPDIFSLESGCPFNPFSRTPQIASCFSFGENWAIDYDLIWQQQYQSTGPSGATADYMKYSCIPEQYIGVTYKKGGFLARVAVDILSLKPRFGYNDGAQVLDRITTVSPFVYLQYNKGKFKLKAKSILASAADHVNQMSGYALCDNSDPNNYKYTPITTTSSWMTLAYGKKFVGALLLGYSKNLGTSQDIVGGASNVYFNANVPNKNLSQMFRLQPEVTYNLGKFTLGLEYMLTGAQYGDSSKMNSRALCLEDLHWVFDNRIQAMIKFTF